MATPVHLLDGVWAKIKRAEKHLSDYQISFDKFMASLPFTIGDQYDEERKGVKLYFKEIKPTPNELKLQIGDTIHNLRSALDLLACQLVQLSVTGQNCEDIYFPIGKDSHSFPQTLKKKGLDKLFRDDVLRIIKQIEPYGNGKGHIFWQLHKLDIQDKHRLLIVLPFRVKYFGMTITPVGTDIPAIPFSPVNKSGIPKEGDLLAVISDIAHALSPTSELIASGKITAELVINETGIMEGKSAFETLQEFIAAVQGVVKQFEPLF